MKKFLDGPVDQVTEGVTQAIAADAFTFAEYDESAGEKVAWSDYSYWGSTFRMFFKNRVAVALLVLLAAILIFTTIQPYLPGQRPATLINNDPETGMMLMNVAPGEEFWFGTNSIGQDLWSMVWSGTRTSLLIGLAVACSEIVLGITWGCCGGMCGSWTTCSPAFTTLWITSPKPSCSSSSPTSCGPVCPPSSWPCASPAG